MKPEELGLSLLSQSLTFGRNKPKIIFYFANTTFMLPAPD